jgi:RNA polymerase subunit RPABC4/transcription elongation factor Spt4
MPPEDGGWVCIKILIDWRFSSTLVQLIRGLEYLVSHPNPGHLFGSHTCALASEYFRKHPYVPIPRDGTPIEQPAYIIDDTHKPTVVTVVDAVCPNCSKPVEKDWVGCPYCTAHLPRQDAYDRVKHILSRRGAGRRKPRIITPRDEELRQEVEYIFSTSFCPNCHKVIEKEWKGCPYCTYSFD